MTNHYLPPDSTLWQGRADSLPKERFFQIVHCLNLQQEKPQKQSAPTFAILGFCCDEGIKRNLGRVGAKQGPQAIRKALGNLCLPNADAIYLYDIGDIVCNDDNLEAAQSALAGVVRDLLMADITPILLGGGHEIAFGHYLGIKNAKPRTNLGIINFDAHFDLRPLLAHDKGSSGTSFRQMALASANAGEPFNYLCIGLQPLANPRSLFAEADKWHVSVITAEEVKNQNDAVKAKIHNFIARQDVVYVTLCLDVFNGVYAPGVSAPQPLGLAPFDVLPLLKEIIASKKVLSFDIAELSPVHDHNNMTANLAAQFAAWFVVNTAPFALTPALSRKRERE